ncbi:MAG: ATP-binding protein [Chlorobiaceae bacterium]
MKHILSLTLECDLLYTQAASLVAGNVADIFANSTGASGNIAEFCHAFELSVSESFTNSVRYADSSKEEKQVMISFSSNEQELIATVVDTNQAYNPHTETPDIASYPESGYGLFLINRLMDSVSYSRSEGKNILVMTKQVETARTVFS